MKLILASKNRHKIFEIKSILKNLNWEIITLSDLDPNFVIIEDGKTLEENAIKKAESVMDKFGFITLGEDTGLEVDILNGRPGIFSARYAGENASYEQNVKKLLAELKNVPLEKRMARFRCVCAVALPKQFNRKTEVFQGICEGHIIDEVRGDAGFGYDPIFIPKGYNKTFAEISSEEKNRISHRGKALQKVKMFLKSISKELS